jgi:hypothetical protein
MKLHKSITPERIMEACERYQQSLDNPGFCITCGAEAEGVGGCLGPGGREHRDQGRRRQIDRPGQAEDGSVYLRRFGGRHMRVLGVNAGR